MPKLVQISESIAVATAVRTRTFLWRRKAPPQKRPKKSGYSYNAPLNVGLMVLLMVLTVFYVPVIFSLLLPEI